MSKVLVTLLAVTAVFAASYFLLHRHSVAVPQQVPTPVYDLWQHWKEANGKVYGGEAESQYRLSIFNDNYNKIKTHTENPDRTYEMAFNKFMDLTSSEFSTLFKGFQGKKSSVTSFVKLNDDPEVPASVDWRTGSTVAVGAVKDQGQCGSCWAFSTVGSLEGASALYGEKKLQSFSESQLVDCSSSYGNEGCNGGLMDNAFQYVQKYGITTEAAYPYKPTDGKCKTQGGAFKITGYTDVAQGDAKALAAACAKQPVSVAVDANNFQFYDNGVFSDCQDQLDHGVTLVGYTADAWIVKNSWGESWGESGYIRIKRGNTCGIANAASYPTL